MSVRCKMQLFQVTESAWSTGSKQLTFSAQYDQSIPEDQRFAKATPTAQLTMTVDSPAALEQFKLGDSFYVDFTPVPKE
jgi:hypothetical protein